jgi:hypothetical protein
MIDLGEGTAIVSWQLFPALGFITDNGIGSSLASSLASGTKEPSTQLLWVGAQSSYVFEWKGAHVVLTLEDGSSVSYDISGQDGMASTDVTIPAAADVNHDGKVTFTASVTPNITFYNWTAPYFRYDEYWYWAAFAVKVQQATLNQYTGQPYDRVLYDWGVGPALSYGISVSYQFDDFLDQALAVETPYKSYATLNAELTGPSTQARSSFTLDNLPPVRVKGAITLQTAAQ